MIVWIGSDAIKQSSRDRRTHPWASPRSLRYNLGDERAIASIDLSKLSGKAKRINITMPESILGKVDSFAAQKGETRSGLLQTAVLNYIAENS